MSANDPRFHRRSIRLPEYDYSREGAYYVTICAHDRECLFGDIRNGRVWLNQFGNIARECWEAMPQHFANVLLDEYIIMPNHVHGIVIITERSVGTRHAVSLPYQATFGKPETGSMSTIVRSYKSAVTRQINLLRSENEPAIWQGRFWEHVIRNEKSLNKIREYIRGNPWHWATDDENPESKIKTQRVGAIHELPHK